MALRHQPVGRPHRDAPPPLVLVSPRPAAQSPRPDGIDAAGEQERRRRRRRQRKQEEEDEREWSRVLSAKKKRRKRRTHAGMPAARAPPPAPPTPYAALPPCAHGTARGCGVLCRQELWADLQFLKYHYIARQDFPVVGRAEDGSARGDSAAAGGRYVIVDREPHADMVPRYIVRRRRPEERNSAPPAGGGREHDDGAPSSLMRVKLHDIDRVVSVRDLERFENRRFELRVPDSSTLAAWRERPRAHEARLRGRQARRRRRIKAARDRLEAEAREAERGRVVAAPWAEGVRVVILPRGVTSAPAPPEPSMRVAMEADRADSASAPREAANKRARVGIGESAATPWDAMSYDEDDEDDEYDEHDEHDESGDPAGEEEEYTISRILSHKLVMNITHFLCAWEGLPESKAMWIAEDELKGAEDAIVEYFERFEEDAEWFASSEESLDESPTDESIGTASRILSRTARGREHR